MTSRDNLRTFVLEDDDELDDEDDEFGDDEDDEDEDDEDDEEEDTETWQVSGRWRSPKVHADLDFWHRTA